jgi:hypothetical protein
MAMAMAEGVRWGGGGGAVGGGRGCGGGGARLHQDPVAERMQLHLNPATLAGCRSEEAVAPGL